MHSENLRMYICVMNGRYGDGKKEKVQNLGHHQNLFLGIY